jgi:serine/threonine protein kinase
MNRRGIHHRTSPDELVTVAQEYGFTVEGKIDEGASGFVFAARDKNGAKCALKILKGPFDNIWERRFQREAEILSRLTHPQVVAIHPPGLINLAGEYAFAMEFVEGISLRRWLDENGTLTKRQALGIATKITEALEYVHHHRIIHRDLHAGNILLLDKDLEKPKIADFGTAREFSIKKVTESDSYKTFRPIGAMSHCAPEKWVNPHKVGEESDIFSLGVLLYNALTGRYPFWEESYIQLFQAITNGAHIRAAEINPEIGEELDKLLEKMLESSQIYRVCSAARVRAIIEELLSGTKSLRKGERV